MIKILEEHCKTLAKMGVKMIHICHSQVEVDLELAVFLDALKPFQDQWHMDIHVYNNNFDTGFAYLNYKSGDIEYLAYIPNVGLAENMAERYNIESKYYEEK